MSGPVGPVRGRASRLTSSLTALLSRLQRRLPGSRVLQVEEIAAAVVEHVRTHALAGLKRRYLPSSVTAVVSPADLRYLEPFHEEVSRAVRRALDDLAAAGADRWRATATTVDIELRGDATVRPGGAPVVSQAYPAGARMASWSAAGARVRLRAKAGASPLALVMTAVAGAGTALQETVLLWLGRELPRGLIEPGERPGEKLRVRGGVLANAAGTPWNGAIGPASAEAPPEAPRRAASLPPSWDAPWARLRSVDGRALLWCAGGVLLLGRDPARAHLVPAEAPSTLSAAHLALWRAGEDVVVVDLGSTNGTWDGDRRLAAGRPVRCALPLTLRIGVEGRLVLEVRR